MISTTESSQPMPMSTPEADAYARKVEALGRQAQVEPTRRVDYGPLQGQQFDVYEPAQAQGAPVLVFLHGGAWTHGSLDWLRFMAPVVQALPAVLIGVTYRLAPQHRWPAGFDDTCSALSAIHRLVVEQGYDADRIVVAGHSAGGHLASLAALRQRFTWIRACFPVSSRFDMHTPNPAPGSGEERVYKLLFNDPAHDLEASPIRYIRGNTIPFHIVWGENDFARITGSSQAMVAALKQEGCPVTHEVVAGAGHFDTHLALAQANNPWWQRLKQEFAIC